MRNIIEYEGVFYFYSFDNNVLFELDPDAWEAKALVRINPEYEYGSDFNNYPDYGAIIASEGKIFIVPEKMMDIIVYDISEKKTRSILLKKTEYGGYTFRDIFTYENDVFLLPKGYDSLIKINTLTETIEYIYYAKKLKEKYVYSGTSCQIDNKIYFSSLYDSDFLWIYMLQNNTFKKLPINAINCRLSSLFAYHSRLYIVPFCFSGIYEYDIRMNEVVNVYADFDKDAFGHEDVFDSVRVIDDEVYLLPRLANKGLIFDLSLKKYKEFNLIIREKESEINKYMPIANVAKLHSRVIAVYSIDGKFVDVNSCEEIEPPIIHMDNIEGIKYRKGHIYIENNGARSLESFVDYLTVN